MWAPGNKRVSGFTLVELLLVLSIIVMVSAGVGFALRDNRQSQLEREAQRLLALLESARAQSRASGVPVYWHAEPGGFAFAGLPRLGPASGSTDRSEGAGHQPKTRWLDPATSVQDEGVVVLGPDPIIERQQIVLLQDSRSLRIATDGLRPFAVQQDTPDATGGASP